MSGPTVPAALTSATATGSGSTGSVAPTGSTVPTGVGSTGTPTVEDDFIYERNFLPDPSWPADLHLDILKGNWEEWNC